MYFFIADTSRRRKIQLLNDSITAQPTPFWGSFCGNLLQLLKPIARNPILSIIFGSAEQVIFNPTGHQTEH
jgi:hypothetical protein